MHHRQCVPLSAETREWEIEQLRAKELEVVPWDPGAECPWCREGRPHPEEEGSGPPQRNLARRKKRRGGWDAMDRMGGVLLLCGAVVTVIAVLIAERIGLLRWP
jgi:hypothetical protein